MPAVVGDVSMLTYTCMSVYVYMYNYTYASLQTLIYGWHVVELVILLVVCAGMCSLNSSSGWHACMYKCILSVCRRTICICGGPMLTCYFSLPVL